MKKYGKLLVALLLTVAMIISLMPLETLAVEQIEPLRILTIGNSHANDSTWQLAKVFEAQSPNREVILGTMYYSGCTISQHINFATNNKAVYSYHKNVDGVWSTLKESTLLTALEDENWDIVVLQEMNNQAAAESSFQNNNIAQLMSYVKKHQDKEPIFYWNMVWANPTDPTFWDPGYEVQPPANWIKNYETQRGTDQVYMYEMITYNAQKYVETNADIDTVFPTGTVVQYANHALGQTDLDLYRDYTHLSDFSRLMVAYLWYTILTGEVLTQVKLDVVPQILRHSRFRKYGDLTVTEEMKQVILEAVNHAVENPYEVPDPPVTAVRCEQCRTEPQWTAWDGSPLNAGDGHYYLTKDVNTSKSLLPEQGCISINLNGYSLTHSGIVFEVVNGMTLSLMDSEGESTVKGTVQVSSGGTLSIHSGNISGSIIVNGGSLSVRGGRIDTVDASGSVKMARNAVIVQLTPMASAELSLGDILTVTSNFIGSVGLKINTELTDGMDIGNSEGAVLTPENIYLLDNTDLSIVTDGTELLLQEKSFCHQCGLKVIWKPLRQANLDTLGGHGLTPGHYILGENVSPGQLSLNKDGTRAGTYCLDLAGYTLSGTSRAFLLYSGSILNVTDSVGGGIVEGKTSSAAAGGVLYAYAGSSFHLYGGTMRYNTAVSDITLSGGVVHMNGGDFYIHGGQLQGGNVSSYGGTVYIGKGGSLTASGGRILTGEATNGGACVYVTKDSTVTLSGDAEIEELCFADGSADTLSVDGVYTGAVTLKYIQNAVLEDLTDIGNTVAGDVSLASIRFADISEKTAAVKGDDLVVSDLPYSYGSCEACGECRWMGITDAQLDTYGKNDLPPGHYRLVEDVSTVQQQLNRNGDHPGIFCFDLNGHSIFSASRAFLLCAGATLNVMDSVGGGIIEGKTTSAAAGGVLYAYAGSSFHLYGGTMRYSTAMSDISLGGGVVYMNGGDFYLHGGCLEGGNVSNSGGTVFLGKSSTFTASGGEIRSGGAINGGDCVYVAHGCIVTLSGDANIAEICFAEHSIDHLNIEGNYTGSMTLKYQETVSLDNLTVVGNAVCADVSHADIILADAPGKTVAVKDDDLVVSDLPYTYGTCEACGDCQWIPTTDEYLDAIGKHNLNPGHYILIENATVSQQQLNSHGDRSGTFCFDLNGHTITGSTRAFLVCHGAKLNIMDSAGGGIVEGQGSAEVWGGAIYQYENTTVSLYGGTVRHNTARTETVTNGGAICVKGGNFYLYGGTVEGAKVTGKGAAVYVDANNGVYGSFIASGGSITMGSAETAARCIYVAKGCTVELSNEAQLGQITFASSSETCLTIDGNYRGTVQLQYLNADALTAGTVLGILAPNGDLSKAHITLADVQCKTVGVYEGSLLVQDNHQWGTSIQDATCTMDGYVNENCTVCGDRKFTVIPAAGHSYDSVTVEATCTADGSVTNICAVCDDRQIIILHATGHNYESSTVNATCTTDGSVTIVCADCGDTKTAIIFATGHSFTEGICGTCGEVDPDYVKPVVQPTLKLKAPALEFKDMIKVIAFFTAENLDSVVEMGMITYTENVEVVDITTAAHVIPGAEYDAGTGRYYSSSQGIHAKYLGDDVYLAIYAKLSDGSYVYTRLVSYSPITYASNQLKNSNDMNLKQLVAAMLNYGAAAQNYFGYKTDALANATMTEEQIALPEAYRADMVNTVASPSKDKQGIFANNKGFGTRRPAVSFEGAFSINYFFTPNYTPVDGITMYYWTEAAFNAVDVLTVENASGSVQMSGEGVGQYRGDIEGIAAKSLSESVYVAAVYSDGTTSWTSGVLGYSIGAYCSSQATKGGTMADLAMATAVYGYHAKAFFG